MQFPAEFEWIAPSGRGLLTAYMVNHYGAGWAIDNAPTSPRPRRRPTSSVPGS
jgi:hypothetical protein